MFEALFGGKRRPTKQEFATRLLAIAWDGNMHGRFYDALKMTEVERLRYVFTTYLFTVTLPMTWVSMAARFDVLPFVSEACALTLESWGKEENYVRLGDFVITNYEYDRLPETLARLYKLQPHRAAIEYSQLRLRQLLDASAYIRGERQGLDIIEVSKSTSLVPKQEELYGLLGVRLLTYIFTQDTVHEWSGLETMRRNTVFDALVQLIYERTLVVFNTL
jgi:hypothetical protein